jgi:SAM-dependent methyltransferase
MPKVQSIADPHYVKNQYQTASNLNARIRLHQQFSTNTYGWQHWIFDQLKLHPGSCILELGCGAGNLLLENITHIPTQLEITVSDFSPGMLEQAKQNLQNNLPYFHFKVVDAQFIPFDKNSFDIVIANHMLYHLPDKRKALLEIKRVLKQTGFFYASTIGCNHLKELTTLINRFDAGLATWDKQPADSFNLENGSSQLGGYFKNISLSRYADSLIVTDAKLLTDYILSGRIKFSTKQKLDLVEYVEHEMKANNGTLFITKDSGLFEANNI